MPVPNDPKFPEFLKSIIDGAKGGPSLPPLGADAGFLGNDFAEASRAGFEAIRLPVSDAVFAAHVKRTDELLRGRTDPEAIAQLTACKEPILLDGKPSLTYEQATLAFDSLLCSKPGTLKARNGHSEHYFNRILDCENIIIRLFWPATTRGQPIRDWKIDRGLVAAATLDLAEALYDPEQAINVCLNARDAHCAAREVAAAAETARNAVRDQSPRPGRTP